MALKICEDCKKEISTLAVSCPNCGRPNANAGIVTIEKTQKKWKRKDIIGFLFAVPGFFYIFFYLAVFNSDPNPNFIAVLLVPVSIAMVAIGVLIVLFSGVGRWYHHG